MAKLTDVRDTPEIANGAKVIAVPVKGGTTIIRAHSSLWTRVATQSPARRPRA